MPSCSSTLIPNFWAYSNGSKGGPFTPVVCLTSNAFSRKSDIGDLWPYTKRRLLAVGPNHFCLSVFSEFILDPSLYLILSWPTQSRSHLRTCGLQTRELI